MDLTAVFLSRLQFAFTIAFHIIFPTFTIGLSAFIATLLVMWRRTGREQYRTLARFWTRIFAVSFGMGVVSGVVLSYQFGTNWSGFSEVVGNIVGPLLGYEVLMAFFLEATFLGIMLFGWKLVPPWLHVTSAILVAIGTVGSAFWIISANSWMQVPAGFVITNGIAYPADWLAAMFSPTFPIRFIHMVTGAYLTTAFVVLSVGARYLLAGKFPEHARTMLKMGTAMAAVLAPLQVFIGDQHGLQVAEYQPAKLAAIEAHWENNGPAALVLFAVPNEAAERNDFEIAIPYGGSLIVTHSLNGTFAGLKDFPPQDRPPVDFPFYAFRIMVGIGVLMIAIAFTGVWLWWRGRLATTTWFLRVASISWPAGFIAIISGWTVAEVGRQPWVATGILRTVAAVSPVPAGAVAASLILFVVVYFFIFGAGLYYVNRLINRGPEGEEVESVEGLPNRPISAAKGGGREAVGAGGQAR